MNSDLIVMTFPLVDGGHRAWRATEILRDRQTLGLEYAAVVTKKGAGRPVFHYCQRLPVQCVSSVNPFTRFDSSSTAA